MYLLIIFILILILLSLLIYSIFVEPYQIERTRYKIGNRNLGLKILHLTDFHSSKIGTRENKILQILDNEEYDIVLFTGDFFESIKHIGPVSNYFSKIINGKPAFGVLGNNDYGRRRGGDRINRILEYLEKISLRILLNESMKFSDRITIVGIDDPHKNRDNVNEAFKNVAHNSFKIVLMHSPEALDSVLEYNPDLILTGHTHGGQVKLPLIGPLFQNVKKRIKVRCGINKINNSIVVLSRGIGTTLLPIRFLCRPQIIFLEI